MTKTVQDLLKKISYIDAEIEIQKQILYSIPSTERDEIEKVLKTIAAAKKDIGILRSEIEQIDPEEFQRIARIEESVSAFKKISAEKKFSTIESMTFDKACVLSCRDGREIHCLVKASDKKGDWTIISMDGSLITLPGVEVLSE
jgi:hypothetical protein